MKVSIDAATIAAQAQSNDSKSEASSTSEATESSQSRDPIGSRWGFNPQPIWDGLRAGCPELPPHWHLSDSDAAELAKSEITPEQACREGIFTATAEQAKTLTGYFLPGLLFSYWKPQDNPEIIRLADNRPFCRIKPDWLAAGEKARAAFRSSPDKPLPKYLAPKDSTSQIYTPRCIKWENAKDSAKQCLIGEGEKSTLAAAVQGITAIGLSGVWNFNTPQGFLGGLKPWSWRGRKCQAVVCFDSDISINSDVKAAIREFSKTAVETVFEQDGDLVLRLNENLRFTLLPNEIDGRKNGTDDLIYRHGVRSLTELMRLSLPLVQATIKTDKELEDPKPKLTWDLLFTSEPCGDGNHKALPKFGSRALRGAMMASAYRNRLLHHPDVASRSYNETTGIWENIGKEELKALATAFCNAQGWLNHSASLLAEQVAQVTSGDFLQSNWDNPRYLAFTNGVMETESDEMLPFKPEYRITSALGFGRDPIAVCPLWLQFLDETFPDSNKPKILQAIFRIILAPKLSQRYKLELIFALVGKPGTGKGVILNIMMKLLGSSYATYKKKALETPEGCFPFLGKKATINTDLKGSLTDDMIETLNQMATNEPVMVRSLYKNGDTVRLNTIPVYACNEAPRMAQDSKDGISRRLISVELKQIPKTVDLRLSEKLEAELPGIFEWVWSIPVDVAEDLIQSARTSSEMVESHKTHLQETNSVYAWLAEEMPMGTAGVSRKRKDLYLEYAEFCKAMGMGSFKFQNWNKEIDKAGAQETRIDGDRVIVIPSLDALDVMQLMGIYSKPEAPAEQQQQPEVQQQPEQQQQPPAAQPEAPVTVVFEPGHLEGWANAILACPDFDSYKAVIAPLEAANHLRALWQQLGADSPAIAHAEKLRSAAMRA